MNRLVSGIILILLLASMLTLAFNIQLVTGDYVWTETIYVRADGSIQPSTAPISSFDNVTYTLTDNITGNIPEGSSTIVIQRNNTIIDGADYTLQGTGASYSRGIELTGTSNVTIKNMKITTFFYAIRLESSSNNSISGNNIAPNNMFGIYLESSSNNSLGGNTVAKNLDGIYLDSSSDNSLSGNNITANHDIGIWLAYFSSNNSVGGNSLVDDGLVVDGSYGNVVTDNLVNGKPLVYREEVSDYVVEDAGQVILVRCSNVTVEDLNLSNTAVGVQLLETSNTTISGNNITENHFYGIRLESSSDSSVSGNNITANNMPGIYLESSSNNSVSGNNITENNMYGIELYLSYNNSISGNNITNNDAGISLAASSNSSVGGNNVAANNGYGILLFSSNSSVSGNNVTANNGDGIYLASSSNNIASGNTVANNLGGIYLESSSNSSLSGNNITNNGYGIYLASNYPSPSYNNSVSGNTIANNQDYGIWLAYFSSNNSVSGNSLVDDGLVVDGSYGNVVTDNFVNGKPLVYREEVSDYAVVEDAGQVILVKCSNITVKNLNLSNTDIGVQLFDTNNTTISGNNITANNRGGIYLSSSSDNSVTGNNVANGVNGIELDYGSSNNSVSGNNITANSWNGIWLFYSSNNSVSGNSLANNQYCISLSDSSENSVTGNNVANNEYGIWLGGSSNSSISGNNITANNYVGIHLQSSSNNSVSGNTVANNLGGIELYSSSDNKIYHNNFINNPSQVYSSGSTNVWDDGSEGNYWSDYLTRYPNATPIGDTWDTPYVIDAGNVDHHPLVNQTIIPEFSPFLTLPLLMISTLLAVIICKKKRVHEGS